MPETEKIFWLVAFMNLLGIALTAGTLWVYSRSLELLFRAITKLQDKIKHLRQSVDSERQGRANPRNRS